MSIRTGKEAMAVALGQTTNVPGMCQSVTRSWFNAPSAGDQDKDGDADAIDGWLSEPESARHYDRTPHPGRPVAFKNATHNGNGHRAMSLENGEYRSTDFDTKTQRYKKGVVGTARSLAALERAMGLVYLGWSTTIDGHPIPKDKKPLPKPSVKKQTRTFAHVSMQFNDSDRAHREDLNKVFAQGFDHITGTEAGAKTGNTNQVLLRMAKKFGYELQLTTRYDTWVAIKKTRVVPGSFKKGTVHCFDRASMQKEKPPGTWGDKGIVWAQYQDKALGFIALGSVHPLTRGGAGEARKWASDKIHAQKISAWGAKFGKGAGLAFMDGDFNKDDQTKDVFIGGLFTSCWDELKVWPNTLEGHTTTIDIVASYDPDTRVKCVAAKAYNDKNFFLNTDHHMIVATYEILVLST